MGKVFALIQPQVKDDVVCFEIDVNDPNNGKLLYDFQIRSIPTSVFINKSGKIDNTNVGVIQEKDMLQVLKDLEAK